MKEKLDLEQKMIFEEADFEIIKQDRVDIDYKEVVEQLPYIFKDPTVFDKKIDPRKLQFGSKINKGSPISRRVKYESVK